MSSFSQFTHLAKKMLNYPLKASWECLSIIFNHNEITKGLQLCSTAGLINKECGYTLNLIKNSQHLNIGLCVCNSLLAQS